MFDIGNPVEETKPSYSEHRGLCCSRFGGMHAMKTAQAAAFAQQVSHVENDSEIYQKYDQAQRIYAAEKFADFKGKQQHSG